MATPEKPTLTLIDGSAYIFRAYHALPGLSNSKGVPTNAVYGFTNMVLKALREREPTHVALVFDARGRTFRDDLADDYKANRSAPPDDLVVQFPLVRDVARALDLPVLEVPGVEADDVIATLAVQAVAEGFRVVIVTGDKDFMQLVTPEIELFDTMYDRHTGVKEVEAKLGVRPDQVVDYMAIIGDAVDNVAGVPGVGPKTAAKLIQEFGTLDAILEGTSTIAKPKLRESLTTHRERVLRNRKLVTLKRDVALELGPAALARRKIDAEACRKLFAELEFTRLLRDLPPPPPEAIAASAIATKIVATPEALAELVKALESSEKVGMRVLAETGAKPVGLAFSPAPGQAFYVPVDHLYLGATQLPQAQIYAALKPFLESAKPKLGHRFKDDWHALRRAGIALAGMSSDVELASFLLNAARREHLLPDLARERLQQELPPDVAQTGKRARPLSEATIEASAAFEGASAEAVLRLGAVLEAELGKQNLLPLYTEMELPLVPVLAEMEAAGILLDAEKLNEIGREAERELGVLLERIHDLAGHPFQVSSNAQLGQVLFVELGLPVLRRTKTGPSVDQEVLEKLALQHPLPAVLLEQRSLAKLKSTYLDTLPKQADAHGRIHTTYNMIGAATGRLSSTDPNLQNIPVRTDLGRRIRDAFVAGTGCVLVSADYSQIELRVLAHFSEDAALTDSFRKDEDVHARTAAEVFGVPLAEVTDAMRRVAKMVNFGIAYGQTSFGLSHRLDIPGADAQQIINRYFERYAGVRTWLDATIASAKETGEVATLFGRKRAVADVTSRNFALRSAAERIAVNTPIQGTAADIVKRAMLTVAARLKAEKLASRMLLQVHDELLFEVPEGELEALRKLTTDCMEGAAELRVPLKIAIGTGKTWASAH